MGSCRVLSLSMSPQAHFVPCRLEKHGASIVPMPSTARALQAAATATAPTALYLHLPRPLADAAVPTNLRLHLLHPLAAACSGHTAAPAVGRLRPLHLRLCPLRRRSKKPRRKGSLRLELGEEGRTGSVSRGRGGGGGAATKRIRDKEKK